MLAPPIIYFAHASFGWQGAFMFTGVLALLWVILWWAFYHNPESIRIWASRSWSLSVRITSRRR
nr:Hexuronate transporter [Raoultella sp. NCTC 9187]